MIPETDHREPAPRAILVVKIDPERQSCTLMKMEQSPRAVQDLTGKEKLGFLKVGHVAGRDLALVADNSDAAGDEKRWHYEGAPICHGVGLIFGFNGKAITSPVDGVWVFEKITWL